MLAERLVYRQPRRLVVRAAEGKKPGGEISLSIQNEKGRPVAAALGLTVLDGGKGQDTASRAAAGPICCTHCFGRRLGESGRCWRASI